MESGGQYDNGRYKPDYYKGTPPSVWNLMPQHQIKEQHNALVMNKKIMSILAERDAALKERNEALSAKKEALAARDEALEQRDKALSERDNAIMERETALNALHYPDNNLNYILSCAKHGETERSHPPNPPPVSTIPPDKKPTKRKKESKQRNKLGEDLNPLAASPGKKCRKDWDVNEVGLNLVAFDETTNTESCAQFSSAGDGSELNAWETTVPCKRRTCVGRPKTSSSVEKLTKDLYNILQEQQQSSVSSEGEDLLFESMFSAEIGHGSVLMMDPPHSFAREEESESSSLSSISDAYSHSVKRAEIGAVRGSEFVGQAIKQEQLKRTKSQTGRVHVLGSHSSPLCSIDLKDVFNFDEFTEQFTEEEQKKLMKLLPQIDSVNLADSLRMMFESAQFKENFSLFQQLIVDGVFEMPSSSGAKLEDIRAFKKLALSDFNKSRLVESYNHLKEREKGTGDSVTTTTSRSSLNPNVPKTIVTIKKHCENQTQLKSESRGLMRSPKSVTKMKASDESKVLTENNGSCFSPRSLASVFAQESGGITLFGNENNCSSDQDLLLMDLPSNGSFPQAELLHQL